MSPKTEPTLAEGVQAIHRQGWYMTFAYEWGGPRVLQAVRSCCAVS